MEDIVEAIRSPSDYEDQFEIIDTILLNRNKEGKDSAKTTSHELLAVLDNLVSNDKAESYTRFAALLVQTPLSRSPETS